MSLPDFLAAHPATVYVRVAEALGSTPREKGAEMIVAPGAVWGTIGGGHLEYMAIDAARRMLDGGAETEAMDVALGPETGQCCGGRVRLDLSVMDDAAREAALARESAACDAQSVVMIYGAGHVGRALALALLPLPFRPVLVDQRAEELAAAPAGVETRLAAMPEAEARAAPAAAAHVILTHDHALDFLIAAEALGRGDAPYVGMIGSATKRARFESWARAEGVDSAGLTCPLAPGLKGDKRPAVIAAFAAVEIAGAVIERRAATEASHAS